MECQCGCGEVVQTASFKPGNDQKLRIFLERRAGRIEGLRELVEAGEKYLSGQIDSDALAKSVGAIFQRFGQGRIG